ncbi:MAG: hypothetical protein IT209_00680 [Armatimonadetes bacterium]|nr:hypothetical protein [Armatimonadota bacterium]
MKLDPEKIQNIIDQYADDLVFGVRWDTPGLLVGHIFPPSREWMDNTVTDETLPGTCILRLSTAFKVLEHDPDRYVGVPYLVAGWQCTGLDDARTFDPGEEVVSDCEIIAVL